MLTMLMLFSLVMTVQGAVSLFLMLYAWEDLDKVCDSKSPVFYAQPKLSFSILLPCRHEENVVAETLRAVNNIDYPKELVQVLVICRTDDSKTIDVVNVSIAELKNPNIQLITFSDLPINKPHGLNVGLMHATNNVVAIFDAEDSPHADILKIINTVMLQTKVDVVQSGVQLMNYDTSWFSALNVLEYFFWFKSTLHFFAEAGIVPLGGNTVFFKKKWLDKIGGWDEDCLTEDADIGIRLSKAKARIKVIYDEEHVTREETPHDTNSFIRQRTRWNQGFFQILLKGDWAGLHNPLQKLLIVYTLLLPELQALLFLFIPFSLYMTFELKVSVFFALVSFIPFFLLILQLIIFSIGLYEFTKNYKFRFNLLTVFKLILFFIPYQLVLSISAVRGVYRLIFDSNNWEKTLHFNAHRNLLGRAYD